MATLEEDIRSLKRLGIQDKNLTLETQKFYQKLGKPRAIDISSPRSLDVPREVEQKEIVPKATSISKQFDSQPKIDAEDLAAGRIESALGSFVIGAGKVFTSVPKAIGETTRIVESKLADTPEEANKAIRDQNIFDELGKIGDEFFENITDINPAYQEETSQKLAAGLGSAAGFISGGLVGNLAKIPRFLLPAVLGSTSLSVEQVEDYKNTIKLQGGVVDANDEANAFGLGALLGTTEALPITKALGRLDKVSGGIVGKILKGGTKEGSLVGRFVRTKAGEVLGEGFSGGLEELTQEAIQQAGSNYIAAGLVKYDPNRKLFEDVGEAAEIGGGVGFILNTLMASIGVKRAGRIGRADLEASARKDFEGLDADEELITRTAKDAQGNLLLPISHSDFQDKSVKRLFISYDNLHRIRQRQEERENDTTATERKISSLITSLEESVTVEEGKTVDPIKEQEVEEVLKFINSVESKRILTKQQAEADEQQKVELENLKTTLDNIIVEELNPSSNLTIKDLSKKRISTLNREQKESIQALNKHVAENASARGFDINKVAEEIVLGPIDFDQNVQRDDPFGEVEEIEIQDVATQRLLDFGVSLTDIQLGNIPDGEIIEVEAVDITPKRFQEIEGERSSLVDRINENPTINTTIENNFPGLKEILIDAVRNNTWEFFEQDFITITSDELFRLREGDQTVDEQQRARDIEDGFKEIEKIRKEAQNITKDNTEAEEVKVVKERKKKVSKDATRVAKERNKDPDRKEKEKIVEQPKEVTVQQSKAIASDTGLVGKQYTNPNEGLRDINNVGLRGKAFLKKDPKENIWTVQLQQSQKEVLAQGPKEEVSKKEPTETKDTKKIIEERSNQLVLEAEARIANRAILSLKKKKNPSKANQKTVEQAIATPAVVETPQSNIDYALGLWERIEKGEEAAKVLANTKYKSVKGLKSYVTRIKNQKLKASEDNIELDSDQQEVANQTLANITHDEKVAKKIIETDTTETQKELVDVPEIEQASELSKTAQLAQENQEILENLRDAWLVLEEQINIEELTNGRTEEFFNLQKQSDIINKQIKSLRLGLIRAISEGARIVSTGNYRQEIDTETGIDIMDEMERDDDVDIDELGFLSLEGIKVANNDKKTISLFGEQIKKYQEKIFPEIKEKVDIFYIDDVANITNPAIINWLNDLGRIPSGAYFNKDINNLKKDVIYVFGQGSKKPVDILMHEIVGHYGMRNLLGKDWDSFKSKLFVQNNKLAAKIYETTFSKWGKIYTKHQPEDSLKIEITLSNGEKVETTDWMMLQLADEYIAVLAEKFSNPVFKNELAKNEKSILRRVFAMIKHIMKKIGLGTRSQEITDKDLVSLLSNSFSRIFQDPVINSKVFKDSSYLNTLKELGISQSKDALLSIEEPIPFSSTKTSEEIKNELGVDKAFGIDNQHTITNTENLINYSIDPIEVVKSMGAPDSNILEVNRLREAEFASTNRSAYQKSITNIGNAINKSPLASRLNPLGKILNQEEYLRQSNLLLGRIQEIGEDVPKHIFDEFTKLNDIQKEQVFNFFTTKDADVEELDVGRDMKDTISKAKIAIRELGRNFTEMGLLSEESFEQNKDAYLPRLYLKYLNEGKGAGKAVSFQSYLKRLKDVPPDIRNILDSKRIKDPAIVVSDTIATLGRDQAILSFMNNIDLASRELGVSWSLRDEFVIKVDGRDWYIPDAKDHLESVRNLLVQTPGLSEEARNRELEELRRFEEAILEGERAANTNIARRAEEAGYSNVEQFLDTNYRKLPNSKKFGRLRNSWVRKEIFDDLRDTLEIFDPNQEDKLFNQWFGPRGKLVQWNQTWKQLKVPFNIPSWFRNGVGNLVLLDISSRRNLGTLTKWVNDEALALAKGEDTKWAKLARDRGLFGTTVATQELNIIRKDFINKVSRRTLGEEESKGLFNRTFAMFNDNFIHTAEFLSKQYGNMEGLFKTVRMKDHILEWEKLTGQSFDSLKGAEREAVIDEAVRQANEAIFDYSKVPNFLRQIRRYPLGAPFITFTYKSFPQIIRSVARRPQKFIKYAALPMIMHHMFLAMNPDLDDDDFEQIQRDLPLQMKEKSSVYVLPVKDDNGNWQYIPLGYYLPWAPFHESAMNMMNNIDTDSAAGMLNSTYSSVLDTLDNFGFLGGPVPQLVTAFSSGIDSFTGRPIVEEGASPQRKLAQRLTWTWGLAAPSWLTNYGVLGKVLDNAEISLLPGGRAESTDALGRDKETGFQVASRLFGANVSPINREINRKNTIAKFEKDVQALVISRNKIMRSRIPAEEKAKELRDINLRIRRTREKQREALQ